MVGAETGRLFDRLGDDLILLVHQDTLGNDRLGVHAKGHDRHDVPGLDQVSRCAIDDDLPGTLWTGNHIGFQPRSVGDGGDEDLFAIPKIDCAHKVGRDGNAAFVINVGIGDSCAVDLGFELDSEHGLSMCLPQTLGQDGNGESAQPGVRRPNFFSSSPAVIWISVGRPWGQQ